MKYTLSNGRIEYIRSDGSKGDFHTKIRDREP